MVVDPEHLIVSALAAELASRMLAETMKITVFMTRPHIWLGKQKAGRIPASFVPKATAFGRTSFDL
jgi:hypothetical protein